MIEKNKPMYSLENILNTLEKDGPSDEARYAVIEECIREINGM